MMLSLFTFKHGNAFRLYSLLFITVVFVERYFVREIIEANCGDLNYPYFFAHNYIRLLFLLLPFFYLTLYQKDEWEQASTAANIPFLFLGLSILALPYAQITYIILFAISGIYIRPLRIISAAILLPFGIYLFTPNFMVGGCRSTLSSIKANAHTFQTALETYAVDWQGKYPDSVAQLKAVGQNKNYWKDFKNPVGYSQSIGDTSKTKLKELSPKQSKTLNKSGLQLDFLGVRLHEIIPSPNDKGVVLYYKSSPTSYFIYAVGSSNTLTLNRGQPFTLTNS